jgi:hypothetical protein
MSKKTDKPNTIELTPKLATIATFSEKLINDAGFKLVHISMDGQWALSNHSLPEVVIDDTYRIAVVQSLRQRYYIPRIEDNFATRIKLIRDSFSPEVCISIRTFTLRKGRTIYTFRVYGQKVKTVILKSRNKVPFELLNVNAMMKELAGLFESTCRLVSGKYKDPMRCGLSIK